ncbi:MAG: hypothetical protein ABIJ43_02660 [Candidatus Beckwithbacteria bacterium]|nr:hypothetical protein [Patescibacteria group bacterium]
MKIGLINVNKKDKQSEKQEIVAIFLKRAEELSLKGNNLLRIETEIFSVIIQFMQAKRKHPNKKIILFVDRGDIVRSPVAKAILENKILERDKQDHFIVVSTRTQGITPDDPKPISYPNLSYYPQYDLVKEWLDHHGIDLSTRYSTGINTWFAEKANVIFAMDVKTQKSLLTMFPNREEKIHLFSEIIGVKMDIKDPELVKDEKTLTSIFNEIKTTIDNGFDELLKLAEGTSGNNIEKVFSRGPEKL